MLRLIFMHPDQTSGTELELPPDATFQMALDHLLQKGFITDHDFHYEVLSPQGELIDLVVKPHGTLAENGIVDGSTILLASLDATGTRDLASLLSLWNDVYPYLDQLGTGVTLSGGGFAIGTWARRVFGTRLTPNRFASSLTHREQWNVDDLTRELAISPDEAKGLLKGFGYVYNRRLNKYQKSNRTDEIVKEMRRYG